MSALHITLTNAGYAALVNAQNTGTNSVLVNRIGVTEQAFDSSTAAAADMTVLPGELKQLSTFAGDAVADDTIHVTIRDDGSDSYSLRGFGIYLADGTLLAVYGQLEPILEKSVQAMLLLAADIRFTDIDTAILEFGDTNWINPPATDRTPGVVQLATAPQAAAGVDLTRAMTPATHKAAIDARFGADAPSGLVKGLLGLATATLVRTALGIKGAALKDEGIGNELDADLLDGQHGAYYRDYRNLSHVPASFPPTAHGHDWGDIDLKPATATRWPTFAEVKDKPQSYPPQAHVHAARDIQTGVFDLDRIPVLPIGRVEFLDSALSLRAPLANPLFTGSVTVASWASISADGGARVLLGNNCTLGVDGLFRYARTHAGLGASGIVLSGFGDAGPVFFDTGDNATTAGDAFQPTLRTMWHSGNFDPGTKADLAGATFNGEISAPVVHALAIRPVAGQGFSVEWNSVQPGYGATEYICNYGGGSGGHFWYSRESTASDPGLPLMALDRFGQLSTAGGFATGSSRSVKRDLGDFPYGLAEVEAVAPARFAYLPNYRDDDRPVLGWYAEDVQALMPEPVRESDGPSPLTMQIDQLVAVLWQAVRELSTRVRELEAS